MSPNIQITCSFALTFGVPVVFAAIELWRLKPAQWRPPHEDAAPPDPAPLPDPGVLPRVQKPLPDCLIPRPATVRVRELA
jgi:hypothetical protein